MSDEIDAVRRSALTFRLGTLQVPASRASAMARSLRAPVGGGRTISVLPMFYFFLFAMVGLFFAWLFGLPWDSPGWVGFWVATLTALVWVPLFARLTPQREAQTQPALYLHRGIQALRQAAASGDDRLAPAIQNSLDETSASNVETPMTGRLQRIGARSRGVGLLVMGVVLILLAASWFSDWPIDLSFSDASMRNLWVVASTIILVEGMWIVIVGAQWLRPFEITTEEQCIRWRQPTFGFERRTVRVQWPDVRAFVTFRASKGGETSADMDHIYLFETEKHAVAWKITPKTSPGMREAHERFVRLASEHIQLRDITISLRNLLESPDTRSYEYVITILSDRTPVSPTVRAALLTQARAPGFQRVYPIVSAVLLTLLVVAGVLLQTGVIPAAGH